MKARLTKNLKVKSVTTYLVIEKEQERKDIQQFLNGNEFYDEVINESIKEYLRKIGVLDENNIPTQKGNEIKKTGKMFAKEEGKYKIWYVEEENFIGNKILFIRRIAPKNDINSTNLKPLKTKLDKENHFCLPTQQNDFFRFNLINGDSEKPYEPDNNQYMITLTWEWDNLEKSSLIFKGNLSISPNEKNKSDIVIKTMNLSFEDNFRGNLRDFIKKIFIDWDTKTERLKIRFQELDNHEKETFEKNISIRWNGFDIQFKKVPLMPYDKENAEKWRNWLVTQELEEKYFNRNDFSELVKEINQKPALEPFHLSSIKPFEFLKIIGKSENPKPYWHLRATLDLNPIDDIIKSYSKIELEKNRRISFKDLAQKLKSGLVEVNKPFDFFYYDRYIKNNIQQKTVMTFIHAIQATRSYVITDTENSYSNLFKNEPNLNVIDLKKIFDKSKPAHDRYLVLKQGEKLISWVCTNSIDYIRFDEQNFDEKTLGTIQQGVVFARINNNTLDENLRTFIKSK